MGDGVVDTASPAGKRARSHYRSFADDNRLSLAVAEWGEDDGTGTVVPFIVYWKPFTLADHAKAFGGERRNDARNYADLVYWKALGKDGRRLFAELVDLHILKHEADQTIVSRIANAIMAAPSLDEAKRKLQGDGLRMRMFVLAERLGKTIGEIEQMPIAEFIEHEAFNAIRKEKHAS